MFVFIPENEAQHMVFIHPHLTKIFLSAIPIEDFDS